MSTVYSQSVTFTATVAASVAGTGTPTGIVTFDDGTTSIGTGLLNGASTDVATFTTTLLSVASHTVTAVYGGDTNFTSSSAPQAAIATVSPVTTTATLTCPVTSSVYGQPVSFTVAVQAAAGATLMPTGTVTFYDSSTSIGTGSVSVTNGQATYTTSASYALGLHTISAY